MQQMWKVWTLQCGRCGMVCRLSWVVGDGCRGFITRDRCGTAVTSSDLGGAVDVRRCGKCGKVWNSSGACRFGCVVLLNSLILVVRDSQRCELKEVD